ncbi:MAG: hypothetical protein JW810_01160 [Sedimentisphaerales bacterium]|nr:hypothetical protein [Sedimentisphaerales bacterium]
MVLSKRETYILLVTVSIVAVLILDRYALTPFLDLRRQSRDEKLKLQDTLFKAESLLRRRHQLESRWRTMTEQGVRQNVSETESQVLHEVRNWSRASGLNLSSIHPDRLRGTETRQELTFLVSGTGNMRSVGQFLYQVETASLPLRLLDVQISSRQEAADDMSCQLTLSAIHFDPKTKESAPQMRTTLKGRP